MSAANTPGADLPVAKLSGGPVSERLRHLCIPGPSPNPNLPVPGGPTAICRDGAYPSFNLKRGER